MLTMRRNLLIALTAASLLLVGCGTSGGEDSSDTTAPKDEITQADLEAILPTADDIGPEWTVKESSEDEDDDDESTTTDPADEEEDPTDAAFKEACPKAAELDILDEADDSGDDEVTVEFETKQDQTVEVALDPSPPSDMNEENFTKIIEAFNECGTIKVDDPDAGPIEMTMDAESIDLGDYGAKISFNTSVTLFGQPLTIDFTGYLFVVDGIGVSVTVAGGLDENTFEPTPAPVELLPDLSAEMESRVKSLTD